jgi:nitroimidazol reductase NimA-like FMN-containing flavoprotein (pyridoxamine 5'-phosphate oxidase superfamily)
MEQTMIRTRPNMPHYGIATEEAGMLEWAWVDERMAKSRNYWIGSTRPDGKPHVAPVWGVWVEGTLYFGSHRKARKSRNFDYNPQVVVHLESGDETVIIEGVVEETTDKDPQKKINAAYREKYPPYDPGDEPEEGAVTYAVKPHTVFAWTEADYPNTATRWQFRD